jgi:hypothetical protein
MLLDEVLRSRMLRKALEAGEEQVGKAMAKLLSSDLTGGLQTIAASAAHARETFERGVTQALHAANLPAREDVDALKRRLAELESMLDGLADKIGPGARPRRAAPGEEGER